MLMSGYELIPALQALRAGDKAEARHILAPILESNPTADAWLLMAKAQDSEAETIASLRKALELDPDQGEARQLLEELGASVDDLPTISDPDPAATALDDPFATPASQPAKDNTQETVDPDAEGVYEMLWDCKFCNTTKLLGKSQKFCPVCGATQDPSWRYFPADEDKVAVKDHKFVGVDVVCGSCGNLNSGDSAYCTSCGAPLEGGTAARKLGKREKDADDRFEQEDLEARRAAEQAAYARGESLDKAQPMTAQTAKSDSGGIARWMIFAGIAVVLVLCGGIAFFLFSSQEVSASVVDHSWERTINLERLEEESRNDVCDRVPASSRDDIYRRQMEVIGSERVQVGEDCRNVQVDQGDGTFRQERRCDPVYENRDVRGEVCYYNVLVWDSIQSAVSSGGLNDPVEWPRLNIRECSSEREGCEREAGRDTDYYLHFETANGDDVRCNVDEAVWRNASNGDAFNVEVARVGGACQGAEPAN